MRVRTLLVATLAISGCATIYKAAGFPPEATRKTPPTGLAGALGVSDPVPARAVLLTDGTQVSLVGQPLALIFYRGQW